MSVEKMKSVPFDDEQQFLVLLQVMLIYSNISCQSSDKMGVSFSCPFSRYIDIENGFEAIMKRSMYLPNEEAKTLVQSFSFGNRDSKTKIMKSISSVNKTTLEASVSLKTIEPETTSLIDTKVEEVPSPTCVESPILDRPGTQHDAATKLQKVYKSFRTRRKLADCAVLVQQRWFVCATNYFIKLFCLMYYYLQFLM